MLIMTGREIARLQEQARAIEWRLLGQTLQERRGNDVHNAFLRAKVQDEINEKTCQEMWADMEAGTFSLDDIT
jgi:hypothetical protein